jgi:hypothetical protein
MANIFSFAQIEQFKLHAKFLSRNSKIAHAAALDQVAHKNGFSNWALLMMHAGPAEENTPAKKYYRFTRTMEEMRQAIRKIASSTFTYQAKRETPAEEQTLEICHKFGDGPNAVDFAIAYVECLLSVPRFRVHYASKAYSEMRRWLPYELAPISDTSQILVNRRYKPVGIRTDDWTEYDEYGHLAISLDAEKLLAVAHRVSSSGYLFGDGTAPWRSRENAEKYLLRLKKLQIFLRGQDSQRVR